MKRRVKITFSYDGSHFFGSQIQKNSKTVTVMGNFQKALKALGISNIAQASGRTDRDVHALNQVCHLDIPPYFDNLNKLKNTLNHHLMPYIFIKNIELVDMDFHARFSAKKRLYRYIVSHSSYSPTLADYVLFLPKLDLETINKSMKSFEGKHDFSYFKKQGSSTISSTRVIYKAYMYRYKNYSVINFLGNSFLRSQIRMMCSFLFEIDRGKLDITDLEEQLNLKRKIHTSLVPASGLYLSRIYY